MKVRSAARYDSDTSSTSGGTQNNKRCDAVPMSPYVGSDDSDSHNDPKNDFIGIFVTKI